MKPYIGRTSAIGGVDGPMPNIQPVAPLPPTDITVRLAACNLCAWKVGDRCQHPAQGCAPCKQGRGLSAMLATRAFKCPLKLF